MASTKNDIQYILPNHRIKILGLTIFSLLIFLIFALSNLDQQLSMIDLVLLPIVILQVVWLRKFLNHYSKIGFLINKVGLFDLNENIICKIDDIKRIDASPYTFKSANGFLILLDTKSSFKSIPGLYWRYGHRISIGGLVSKHESKYLAGILSDLVTNKKQTSH